MFDLRRALISEFAGTGLLVASVVGSGVMGERLPAGNLALALLANSLATGSMLVALIFTFAPLSGAHFNPAVTLAAAIDGRLSSRYALPYVVVQMAGGLTGVISAHAMFDLPLLQHARHARSGFGQRLGEFIATFGLVAVIHASGKRAMVVPLTVAAYITAAYWFTSSTSFANPAVTFARGFTETFSGIRFVDVPGFVIAQLVAAVAATLLFRWLALDRKEIT